MMDQRWAESMRRRGEDYRRAQERARAIRSSGRTAEEAPLMPRNGSVRDALERETGGGAFIGPGWWDRVVALPAGRAAMFEDGGLYRFKWWWLELRWKRPLTEREIRRAMRVFDSAEASPEMIRDQMREGFALWDQYDDFPAVVPLRHLAAELPGFPAMRARWGSDWIACARAGCDGWKRQDCEVHEVSPAHLWSGPSPIRSPLWLDYAPWYDVITADNAGSEDE